MHLQYEPPFYHYRTLCYWQTLLHIHHHWQKLIFQIHLFYLEQKYLKRHFCLTKCICLFLAFFLWTFLLHKYYHFWNNTFQFRVFYHLLLILHKYHHHLRCVLLYILRYWWLLFNRIFLLVNFPTPIILLWMLFMQFFQWVWEEIFHFKVIYLVLLWQVFYLNLL